MKQYNLYKKLSLVLSVLFFIAISCATSKSTVKTVEKQEVVQTKSYDKSKLDSLLNLLETNNKWMGSVAVTENGKVIYSKAIGYKHVGSKSKSGVKTKYRIGSISKTFTSTLILMAMEEKKLNLSSTIEAYFPKVKNAKKITIENLLNHRSGIYNFTKRPDFLTWCVKPQSKKELIEMISSYTSVFEPNSKAEYSNSNYVLLSFILEEVYKKSYKEILKEMIIDKIGLKNTKFGTPANTDKNEAFSYSYMGEWEQISESDMSIPLGAGAIVSTPTDLTQFSTALFAEKLIKKSSLNKMTTLKENFGLGIFPILYSDKKGYGHTGGIDGFVSKLEYFPSINLSVAICSNGYNYDNNEIASCALSAYFKDDKFQIPSFKTAKISSEELDQYLGTYSSKVLPMKITFSKKGNILIAFPEGQQKTPLESKGNHVFSFEQAGAIFEFNPSKKTMTLKQGGGEFLFKKD